jgi:hypothetical protein
MHQLTGGQPDGFGELSPSGQITKNGKKDFWVCVVLGLELRAFTLSHSTCPIFCEGFFDTGSQELLAWAGFEPRSS